MSSVRYLMLAVVAFVALQTQTLSAEKLDGDKLLAPDHLLDVRIELAEADWNLLRTQATDPGALFGGGVVGQSSYTYFKADIWVDETKIESVAIRKKGFLGSQDSSRPSLKVKFDEYNKQNPIKGLSRLTLNNNKQDRSQLSQLITYKLFRDAGIHAPRSNFARVTVNGNYLGIYSHVESIKKPFLERSFGNKDGNLYEGTLTDFHPKTIDKLDAKTNEKANDRTDITRLAELLATDGDLDIEELQQVIDVDDFIRYWAIEGMTRFWDGYTANQNNFYYYVNPTDNLGYFIPWGADFALTKGGGPFARFSSQENTAIYAQSILANRLYKTAGVPERYRTAMLSLLDELWNEEALIAEVDRAEKLISPHLHESQADTARAIDELRSFIGSRRSEIQTELTDWPAAVPSEPRKPAYTVAVGTATGSFTAAWSDAPPRDGSTTGTTDIELELDGKLVEFEKLGASAFQFQIPGFGGRGGAGPGAPQRGGPGRFGGGGPAGPGNFKPPVSLNFTGIRQTDGQRITLALFVDEQAFRSKLNDEIDVRGQLTVGQTRGFGFGPRGRSVNGKLRLTKSGAKAGDEIAGTIDLNLVEVHGGIFNQLRSRRGPAAGQVPRPQDPQPPGFGPQSRSIIQTLDQNRDGKLSAIEIDGAPTKLKQLDRNDDGELTVNELSSE